MDLQELYLSKKGTVDDALGLVQDGMIISTTGELTEPEAFLNAFDRIVPRLHGVEFMKGKKGSGKQYPFMALPDLAEHLELVGHLYDSEYRRLNDLGAATHLPSNLHDFMMRRMQYRGGVDLFVGMATPPDESGCLHVSGSGMWEECAYRHAKKVVLEINPKLPCFHDSLAIPLERVDLLYEVDYPITTFQRQEPTETDRAIGGLLAEFIHDGDCIQLGLGGVPDAVAHSFFEKKDLGLHTELFTPVMGDLIEVGVINGSRKTIDRGKHVGNFVLGDERLYRQLAENPDVSFRQASYTNDPFVIAQIDNMVSLNTAMEIDLTGQICSESIGPRQYSGTGGAFDFAFGAQHSKGGRGIIAIASTAKGGTISKIKPILTPGAVVSISRNVADIIATEYGVAYMRGRTVRERAEQLIRIAHPAFREELEFEARKMHYI